MDAIVVDNDMDFVEDISDRLLVNLVKDEPSPGEHRLRWDGDGANGQTSCVEVRGGVTLMLTDVQTTDSWQFDLLHQPTGLELAFIRSCGVRIANEDGADIGLGSHTFGALQIKEPTLLRCYSDGAHEQGVRLMIEPDELVRMTGYEHLPTDLVRVLMSPESMAVTARRMSPRMLDIVGEVTRCQMTGAMRRLYLESKALELVALAMDALSAPDAPALLELDNTTIERLEHARSLLVEQMSAPPALRELARQCGTNERKLKEGFKARFGTTVFGFVRQQRMNRAHELLAKRTRSVTEVAQLVGYANPSKFAAAFRREFGVSPSAVAPA